MSLFIDNSEDFNEDGKIHFEFKWEPIDFASTPVGILKLARKLLELGFVRVSPQLVDGKINIDFVKICHKEFTIDSMNSYLINNKTATFKVGTNRKINTCNRNENDICKQNVCPVCVAGYLYYVEYGAHVNKEDATESDAMYSVNKQKISDISINEEMELSLSVLLSESAKSLFLCFEGEENTGKYAKAVEVGKVLYDLGKISKKKPLYLTLEDIFLNKKFEKLPNDRLVIITELNKLVDDNAGGKYSKETTDTLKNKIKLMEDLCSSSNKYVILMDNKNNLKSFLNYDARLLYKFKTKVIFEDLSDERIYELFYKKLSNELKEQITEDFKNEMIEFIGENKKHIPFKNKELSLFLAHQINHNNKLELPEILNRNVSLEESLSKFVGMENLKTELRTLKSYLTFRKKAEKENVGLPDLNLHMQFLGNPGTGKTTVARVVADLLFELGYVKTNKLIEVERKDLIAAYVGQSAIKTANVIESARGGVLFIDEAYALANDDGFSQEAIATLIKAMEDYKDELVVIFAGYNDEMIKFIEMNPGISSRLAYTFNFEDYSDDELYKIFEMKMTKNKFKINSDCIEDIKSVIKFFSSVENFGNGRFVDKLIQKILLAHSLNMEKDSNIPLLEIQKGDIPEIKDIVETMFNGNNSVVLPSDISEEDKKAIAYHEAGHALADILLNNSRRIKEITIVPEGGGTLGYVLYKVNKKRVLVSPNEKINRIKGLLAGRAAEDIILKCTYAGSSSDLDESYSIARELILYHGISDEIFPLGGYSKKINNEYIKEKLEVEIQKLLKDCYIEIVKLLKEHESTLICLANYLLVNGTVKGEDIESLANTLLNSN